MVNKEIVVTGVTGFIGGHFLDEAISHDIPVTALIRGEISTTYSSELITNINVQEYADYLPDREAILIHLGEPSHVQSVDEKGGRHIEAMKFQARTLMKMSYSKIIYASSATIYSDTSASPHSPVEKPVRGVKVYTDAKIAVEEELSNSNVTIARLTNVYGPGMASINIFSDILAQLKSDGSVKIREATPIREYIWASDVASALMLMAMSDKNGVYNLSSGESVSCEGLARMILHISGQSSRKVEAICPPRESILKLDISKTINDFNWKPQVNLQQGIRKLLDMNCYE